MNIPGFEQILKQAQAMGEQMMRLREELARETVEGSAGGGMVVVKANGQGSILSVGIDPALAKPEELEMLQDLVTAAVNVALSKAKELAAEKTRSLTGGMPLPAGFEGLFS